MDLAESMAEAAVPYFSEDVETDLSKRKPDEAITDNECQFNAATTYNASEKQKLKTSTDKMIFNDGTAAGVLNNLKGCTRTMHLHEADVTLKALGLMLPSPMDITPTRVDPFRSTLMTLHEKPGQFLRVLKKETINVTGSKLNIFVCSHKDFENAYFISFFTQGASTGELVAAELARQAGFMAADALFERFILWPVDGEPISNDDCITSIDFSQYPSLQQFGVLCGFFKNLYMDLEDEGKAILAEQSFNFRLAGM